MIQVDELRWKEHCIKSYPKESCGIIVSGKLIICENKSRTPEQDFAISTEDYAEHLIAGTLEGVLHSHIVTKATDYRFDPRAPSEPDMCSQARLDLPFGISATNGEDCTEILWFGIPQTAPLEGREFIHGVQDCYSIIRDYYKEVLGISLKDYPRTLNWWDEGKDLYSENFAKEGFIEVPLESAALHDVVLMQVASPVINHGAVICGENEILHHLFHRLSGKDSLSKWHRQIVKVIRHKDQMDPKEKV